MHSKDKKNACKVAQTSQKKDTNEH